MKNETSPGRRIVVVANPAGAEALKQALSIAGVVAQVDCAASRAELESALRQPADVVVAAELPGLDAGVILGIPAEPMRLVIFAEAWSEEAMQAAMAAGASDFVWREAIARLGPVVERELRASVEDRRRRAEEAVLREQNMLLERIIDSIPFVLFVKDAEELRLRVVNKTFADAFGTTKEWLLGKLDEDYFPQEQAASFIESDRGVLASKEMRSFEEVARTGVEGEDRVYATRKIPLLDEKGEARWLLGVTEDVTDRKRAESQLQAQHRMLEEANQQLEASLREVERSQAISARSLASYQQRALQMEIIRQQNEDLDRFATALAQAKRTAEEKSRALETEARLRSEFLANFSHEIRTPLNAVIGYADLLGREEGQRLTPHGRRDLGVIKANARTLLALINDILDLSKIESGVVDVVVEDVELGTLVEECTATVREYLKGKPVELVTQVEPAVELVRTDGLKLRQVLLNLLSNAAKFTESGEVVLQIGAEADGIRIVVEDTGVGIPADQLPFVFEKFRQVDGSSTRKVGGTGLGLAIVRELSRLLGGAVEVASTLGRGSTFTVRLPGVVQGAMSKPTPAPVARTGEETPLVLVVDDDPLIHQLLRGELEGEGFEVIGAADGIEALELAREARPSAVVLDLHLPRLDGWSVLAELKSDPVLASVPVILLSVEEHRAKGFSLGACEYLVKPVEPQRLVSVVGRFTAQGKGEVLVVDDDADTRSLVARSLEAAGFPVALAQNGDEALLRLRVAPPSLVILDLVMPGRDGFEVLQQVRAEGSQVPVVVLTGKRLTTAEEQVLREGMANVVQKGGRSLEEIVAEARRTVVENRREALAQLPRILYVEDSPQNRDVVRRYLQGVFEVIEAEDGEHGVARTRLDRPALVLMDLSLPRMDGWEATRRIKADEALRHVPVIALTAHASREDQARAREAGCDDYLTKPVDREALIAAIRNHLEGRSHG
ncbi:DUF3053 family protein [Vulgatibacter sp.]|uniref:DUF3053 family protein n=1 Tax=Vulgatibacter sp. TaxID=1971226 RepID=UPI0035634525